MRIVRSTLLAIGAAAALLGSTAPAHADSGVDLELSIGPGNGTTAWPTVAVTPSVDGDPNTVVGTLRGIIGQDGIEPGTCDLRFSPSPSGTSGHAALGNCATTSFAMAFDYVVDPATGRVQGHSTQAGDSPAAKWRIDCWLEWPPFSAGCRITKSAAA